MEVLSDNNIKCRGSVSYECFGAVYDVDTLGGVCHTATLEVESYR